MSQSAGEAGFEPRTQFYHCALLPVRKRIQKGGGKGEGVSSGTSREEKEEKAKVSRWVGGQPGQEGAQRSHRQASWPRGCVGFGVRGLGSGHCSATCQLSELFHFFICKLGHYQYVPPRADVR